MPATKTRRRYSKRSNNKPFAARLQEAFDAIEKDCGGHEAIVFAYSRASDGRKTETTQPNQRAANERVIRNWQDRAIAEAHIVHLFEDKSASKEEEGVKRPIWEAMWLWMERNPKRTLAVKLDKQDRGTRGFDTFWEMAQENGAALIIGSKLYNPDDEDDEATLRHNAVENHKVIRRQAKSTYAGQVARIKKGEYPYPRPTGLRTGSTIKNPDGTITHERNTMLDSAKCKLEDGTLSEKSRAELVGLGFKMKAKGHGDNVIMKHLHKLGLRDKKGNPLRKPIDWTRHIYCARYYSEPVRDTSRHRRWKGGDPTTDPPSTLQNDNMDCEPLVSYSVWKAANDAVAKPSGNKRQTFSPELPLRNNPMVVCAYCGHTLKGGWSNNGSNNRHGHSRVRKAAHAYAECGNPSCTRPRIICDTKRNVGRYDAMERELLDWVLGNMAATPKLIDERYKALKQRAHKTNRAQKDQRQQWQKELSGITNELTELYRDLKSKVLTMDVYKREQQRLQAKEAELSHLLSSKPVSITDVDRWFSHVKLMLSHPDLNWQISNAEGKQTLLRLWFEKPLKWDAETQSYEPPVTTPLFRYLAPETKHLSSKGKNAPLEPPVNTCDCSTLEQEKGVKRRMVARRGIEPLRWD
jgi:hypothetical protein